MALPECLTTAEVDAVMASSGRGAAWAALEQGQKDVAVAEACRWLHTLCFDEDADCCNDHAFATAWATAFSELALWLQQNPSGIIGADDPQRFVTKEKLGDLEVAYSRVEQSRVRADAPLLLQRVPWLADLLNCWLVTPTGGSRVLSRCC